MSTETQEVRTPEFSLKARTSSGRIELAVWRTAGKEENGKKIPDSFSVKVQKTYYKNKAYHASNTLFPDDLLVISSLCQQAYAYCITHPAGPEEEDTPF